VVVVAAALDAPPPPPPPPPMDLGTAVHCFPDTVVRKFPAGRVAIMNVEIAGHVAQMKKNVNRQGEVLSLGRQAMYQKVVVVALKVLAVAAGMVRRGCLRKSKIQ
jgi:hypothetical protein